MNTDRKAILSLVATGRITPDQAERLLAVGPDGDDRILRLAVCLALSLAFAGTVLPHIANTMIDFGQAMAFLLPVVGRTLCMICGCF